MQRNFVITTLDASPLSPRIGGCPLLNDVNYRIADKINQMGLLISFPLDGLDFELAGNGLYCSVFIKFDNDNLSHLDSLSNDNIEEDNGSIVLIHKPSQEINNSNVILPPKKIDISCLKDEPPYFVQSELVYSSHTYLAEIYFGSEFNNAYPNYRGAFRGAVGYIYINNEWHENFPCGKLILQDS